MRFSSVVDHLGTRSFIGTPPAVSVAILAINEQGNLPGCLRSCAWSDDVHLIDSGSTDRSADLARSAGTGVHAHPFTSFADQRNWALDSVPFKHDWVFFLDADERFTGALVAELSRAVASRHACFLVPSQMVFLNTWIRHAAGYPVYQVRLVRRGHCRFRDFGHGQREQTAGTVGRLESPYVHYPFSKGLPAWLERHNRYSDQDAQIARQAAHQPWLRDLLIGSRTQRRRAAKNLAQRLHHRSTLRFAYHFFMLRGFLDGRAGLTYSLLMAMYESWVERKARGDGPALSAEITKLIAAARDAADEESILRVLSHGSPLGRDFRRMRRAIREERLLAAD